MSETIVNTPVLFAVRDLPISAFGGEHGRQTRKFVLMTIATHADADGTNCYPSIATVARECGLSPRGTQKVIAWLHANRLLDIKPQASPHRTNLFIVLPDGANTSVQGEHQRSGCPETPGRVNGDTLEGERYSSREGERQRSYNLPLPTNRPTKKPTKGTHSKKGTRIPEDFQVTDEHRKFAAENNLPKPDAQIDKFRDYWKAAAGQRAVKLDWDATFRNWLRNTPRYGGSNGQNQQVERISAQAARIQRNDDAIRDFLRQRYGDNALAPSSGTAEPGGNPGRRPAGVVDTEPIILPPRRN